MTHYACNAIFQPVPLVENRQVAEETFLASLYCPEIAAKILPGQFVMIRVHGCNDPLIGRAFAMYDRIYGDSGEPLGIDIIYLVKGKFTQALSRLRQDDLLDIGGPLGNTFSTERVNHLVMAVGGVGQTPMLSVGREALGSQVFGDSLGSQSTNRSGYANKVTILYGARTASRLAGVRDFQESGFDVRLSTDDGSIGVPKQVTDLLQELLAELPPDESVRIVSCGPEPMMAAIASIAKEKNLACEVSLETPMACGIGICFTCVAKVRQLDGQWDYQRTCVEGPIFDAAKLSW